MGILDLLELVLQHQTEAVALLAFCGSLVLALVILYASMRIAKSTGESLAKTTATLLAVTLLLAWLLRWPW